MAVMATPAIRMGLEARRRPYSGRPAESGREGHHRVHFSATRRKKSCEFEPDTSSPDALTADQVRRRRDARVRRRVVECATKVLRRQAGERPVEFLELMDS